MRVIENILAQYIYIYMYKTSYLQRQAEVAEVAKYRHHTCKYEQTCKKSKYVYIYLFICYNITLHIRGMAV